LDEAAFAVPLRLCDGRALKNKFSN